MTARASLVSALFLLGACGDDDPPANVAGQYTINVTNGANDCLTGWQEGASYSNITLDITQDGDNVQGQFQGVAATVFLQAVIGSTVFQGNVSGHTVEMTRLGTQGQTSGNCTFTVRADLHATSDGDLLEGEVLYTPITNGDPNCAAIESCRAVQMFNGTRPP